MNQTAEEHPLKEVLQDLNNYVETRIDLVKFKTIDKTTTALSSVTASVILILGCFFFMILLGIGASYYVGELLGKVYYGFFAVGGFFLLVMVILFLCRDSWLKIPIANKLVRTLFNQ